MYKHIQKIYNKYSLIEKGIHRTFGICFNEILNKMEHQFNIKKRNKFNTQSECHLINGLYNKLELIEWYYGLRLNKIYSIVKKDIVKKIDHPLLFIINLHVF